MEQSKHTPKGTQASLDGLTEQEIRRRLATYIPQKGDHDAKYLFGLENETVRIEQGSVDKKTTIFISNCQDCDLTVDAVTTKIMMVGCRNIKLVLNGVVLTNSVEIWSCQEIQLEVNEILVATLQVDLCSNFHAQYSRRKLFHKMIWAAVENYTLSFKDDDALLSSYSNGYDEMIARYPGEEFQKNIAQFIDSKEEDGQIRSEKLLRLQNGFPTTEREQEEFNQKSERNQKLAEEHYRGIINIVEKDKDLQKLGIKTVKRETEETEKIKPNALCSCNSRKKYKKCCGMKAAPGVMVAS
uniref:C-CAP/cofactor C-like domain-containing protein n=1 Tax=Paramoeba aestuarina TaxID=180227 RepID=A0A7S4KUD8_9EUKA|mmetsp:Transcript_25701/g.40063  ORF Transcript_25701/g.40063 Transcript_25701/m.40063 type:complete len:298 (+) Transcript_25701:145-1038(+)|eukprot:CAMPEP_0201528396 /NCGR_PEP_ID=MMETSP0161_2-20130828/38232_1 /ASSEMBLY_ACC=CAM_ASM_000251 /TAXON_ID=180227 /ORGANISM="Neoparamoeba aestuarina, Strain SoJaBio B1-5/56/2" /LENGTH=297 /DNA_ID=CAMNT_0047929655 /DNA_START=76 /DNA_END=969 /DNA_ORIENTATION=-